VGLVPASPRVTGLGASPAADCSCGFTRIKEVSRRVGNSRLAIDGVLARCRETKLQEKTDYKPHRSADKDRHKRFNHLGIN
jgi:hypothetical protein